MKQRKDINVIKWKLTQQEFIDMCTKVARFHKTIK